MANELDPQVKALLEQFHANAAQQPAPSAKRSMQEAIDEARQMMKSYAQAGCPSEPVSEVKDFDIPGPGGNLPVRLYVPHMENSPVPTTLPVFVYYHGGGFVAGDLDGYDTLMRALANRAQCIVLSVAYRLAPENPYPAANDDVWFALNWAHDHAAAIGADAQRLAIGGDSAGGLLAAWVAQKAAKSGPKLRLQVLLYPGLDATTSSPSWKEFGAGDYILSHADVMEYYNAYVPQGINRKDPKVSPLFATDFTGIAPALIATADHDPVHDEGDAYADKLRAANIEVDHTCWPGMIHGLATLAGVVDAGKDLIDRTGAALKKAFEQK